MPTNAMVARRTALEPILKALSLYNDKRLSMVRVDPFFDHPVFGAPAPQEIRKALDAYAQDLAKAVYPNVYLKSAGHLEFASFLLFLGFHPDVNRPELSYTVFREMDYAVQPTVIDFVHTVFGNYNTVYFALQEATQGFSSASHGEPALHYVANRVIEAYLNATNKQPISELTRYLSNADSQNSYISSRVASILGMTLYDFSALIRLLDNSLGECTYSKPIDLYTRKPWFLEGLEVFVKCSTQNADLYYATASGYYESVKVQTVPHKEDVEIIFLRNGSVEYTVELNPAAKQFYFFEGDRKLTLKGPGVDMFARFLCRYGSFNRYFVMLSGINPFFKDIVKILHTMATAKSGSLDYYADRLRIQS